MSELEPTSTELEPTATERLRALLDERGVEYDVRDGKAIKNTYWDDADGRRWGYMSDESGVIKDRQLFLVRGRMDITPEQAIAATLGPKVTGNTSDGYHTFNELYHHRAVLFSVIVRDHRELAWKSMRHHDGTMYDGMFIVGIETPEGQATYHYDIDPYWDMFNCKELEQAPEWDGHTPSEAIERIATLDSCNCSNNCTNGERTETCRLEDFADVPFSVDYEIEGYDMGSSRDYASLAECNSCGAYVIVPPSYHHVLTCDGDEVYQPYRFCPNCGRRIEVDDG